MQDENLSLLDTVGPSMALAPSKTNKNTYSSATRMLVYDAVVQLVPTVNIPNLLSSWPRRLGIEMADAPQQHCVELMARELGIIPSLQAAEIAMNTPN